MIPFIDLKSQYAKIESDVQQAIQRVLKHGQYILGPEVVELEKQLAKWVGVAHAITCSSGTDALVLSLMAKGIGQGDAVLTTPFTFFATAEAIAFLGATPVFVDVDPATYNIDPELLPRALSSKPRALITVDLFGTPCEYDSIREFCKREKIFLLEDAAQAFGASYKNKTAGALGDVGCTSFYPAKPLGCYGDGGAIFTDDATLANRLKSLRTHGQGNDRYHHLDIGMTGRLDTIQAAVLLEKLKIFKWEQERRTEIASQYRTLIAKSGMRVSTQKVPEGCHSSWSVFSAVCENSEHRTKIAEALQKAGIPISIFYHTPLHLQKALQYLGYKKGALPVTEDLCQRILSLPIHAYLSPKQVEEIVEVMKGASRGR